MQIACMSLTWFVFRNIILKIKNFQCERDLRGVKRFCWQFFINFHQILHAAWKSGQFDDYCLWDKQEADIQFYRFSNSSFNLSHIGHQAHKCGLPSVVQNDSRTGYPISERSEFDKTQLCFCCYMFSTLPFFFIANNLKICLHGLILFTNILYRHLYTDSSVYKL